MPTQRADTACCARSATSSEFPTGAGWALTGDGMFVSTAATQSACPTQCHTSATHNQRHASVTAGAVRIVYSSFKARLRRAGLSGPGRAPGRLVLEEHDQRGMLAAADLPAVVADLPVGAPERAGVASSIAVSAAASRCRARQRPRRRGHQDCRGTAATADDAPGDQDRCQRPGQRPTRLRHAGTRRHYVLHGPTA